MPSRPTPKVPPMYGRKWRGGAFKKGKHLGQYSGHIGNQRLMIMYHMHDVSENRFLTV
jgi:hypothetical protein